MNNRQDSWQVLPEASSLGLLGLIWKRKWQMIAGMVTMLVVAWVYYSLATPLYESNAEVLIIPKRLDPATQQVQLSHFDQYLSMHQALIVSPLIVNRAIEEADLTSLRSSSKLTAEKNLADEIAGRLKAGSSVQAGGSADNILTLSFRGIVPDECPLVVQAVLDSYQSFLAENYQRMSEDVLSSITQACDVLRDDLETQERAYREFRQVSPLVVESGGNKNNPITERLAMIESRRSTLLLRRAELESQLLAIENAKADGREPMEMIALISTFSQGYSERDDYMANHAARQEIELVALLQEEQDALQEYGPQHPNVQSVRRRIEETRHFFALPSPAFAKSSAGGKDTQASAAADSVESHKQYLELMLSRIELSQQQLSTLYESEHESAKKLNNYQRKDEEHRQNIARTRQLYDGVVAQLQNISLFKDYGGFEVRVIAPPREAEKASPLALKVFPAAAVLGGMLGLILAYVSDNGAPKRFNTSNEIQSALGLPVLGQIPRMSWPAKRLVLAASASDVDASLCTHHEPRSRDSEAYRMVWTALYSCSRGQSYKVIQVTSPTTGDGKSTLASNLAVCIAQSGKAVLLVDADLSSPRQHQIFQLRPHCGLGSVIGQNAELTDAIQKTAISNLSVMTADPQHADPFELLTSPKFPRLIEVAREKYDYVLVDTGAILAASDPSVVAPQVDGVLLCFAIAKNSPVEVRRAQEILAAIDANVLGVVVNGAAQSLARRSTYEDFPADIRKGGQRQREVNGSPRQTSWDSNQT